VFIDSDVFLCRPLRQVDFYAGQQLKLFRRTATNAEQLDFEISTHEILGNPLHRITDLHDFIFQPACFRRTTANRLLEEFRLRGLAKKWVARFLVRRRPSEYNLLGYAATALEAGAGYQVVECDPAEQHHSVRFPEDRSRIDEVINEMQSQPKPFALIQSRLCIELRYVEAAFEKVAQGAQKRAGVPASTADASQHTAAQPGWPS
jgi:hypothetical protein